MPDFIVVGAPHEGSKEALFHPAIDSNDHG